VLIPVMIDASQPPFGFGEVQAANLASWNGEADHPHWRRFVDAVMNATNAAPRAPASAPPLPRTVAPPPSQPQAAWSTPPAPEKKSGVPVWVWVVGAVVGTVVVLGVIGAMMPQQQQIAATQPPVQQPVNPPPNQGDQNAQQIIIAQLQQAQAALAQEGFQQVGQPYSGGLRRGESWNVPAELHTGYEYRILGVCDRDCADLDLILFDGAGVSITQDTSTNSQPIVGVLPTTTGTFTIQVLMYNCTVEPCYYAVALYGRPAQQ
jgi:hypothetical protein